MTPYTLSDRLPGAPQSGNDNTIDTSDTRLLNVVYRNGSLWTVHTVSGPATTKTEVAWYRIDPGTGTVLSQGRISDPTRWYYYPSIGVNQGRRRRDRLQRLLGRRNIVGGYYTARSGSRRDDATGLPSEGRRAPYFKTLSGTENRWGDYSATVVDPTDDVTFWTFQEYAATPSNNWERGGDRSFLHHFQRHLPPSGWRLLLCGIDHLPCMDRHSSNEESFVIERKTGAGAFLVIATPSPNDLATYTDGSLNDRTTYTYRVRRESLGDSGNSNESTATTLLATPANATAVAASSTLINISWTDMSAFETGYRVERKTGTEGAYL